MAAAKLHGGDIAMRLPSPITNRLPSIASFAPRRQIVALAAKRSPKRLKYSTPRFTKEGGLVYIEVDPSGGDAWKLQPVIDLLKQGAVGVIPTDTVYAIACDCKNHSAVERLRMIKKIEPSKPLSILCRSLRDIDTFTMGFPRGDSHGHANIFRAVKQCLPGPYTFILTASKELPKQCVGFGTTNVKYASRKNVGVRISDDAVCQAILQEMDSPLICTSDIVDSPRKLCVIYVLVNDDSVKGPKENEWMIDPTAIGDIYGPKGLDFLVDGGVRVAEPSTIVDMTGPYPKVIREGKGPIFPWMVVDGIVGTYVLVLLSLYFFVLPEVHGILSDIFLCISRFSSFCCRFVPRLSNGTADSLAKHSLSLFCTNFD
ncbi:hypothetical protein CARUB_v10016093mg [Capsella rubella]|uniref:Threonylcarbamoyl-AMP synthase n=1 Tax=Capsella rubella TaxID=81985 RepID=R0HSI6_9BRAS|nr:hypothetical protein CARUB_v10016093mg [Capsella rubella]